MPAKEIKELRQSGRLEEALEMAQNELNKHPDNIWGKRNISWVYYEYIKKYAHEFDYDGFLENLTKLKELDLPENEVMVFDTAAWQIASVVFTLQKSEPIDYSKINQVFDLIKEFHYTKPSESYSLLYKAFHKGYQNWSRYLEFADWWNFENFRPEDYQKEEYNGRLIMALVEQAYIAYSKILMEGEALDAFGSQRRINRFKIEEFLPKLDVIIEAHPDYQYPPYFKAKLLLTKGDDSDVLQAFLPFAIKKRNDFWVWELMSDVFPVDDERKIACLCKALSLNSQEDFLINTRQKLAEILITKGLFDEAKTEINKIINTREGNSWRVPSNIIQWTDQPWYDTANIKSTNFEYYNRFISKAEELLYQDVDEDEVVVEFVNKDKKILNFIQDKNFYGFFGYKTLKIKPKIGDVLKIRFQNKVNRGMCKVYSAKELNIGDQSESLVLKTVSGKINIPEGKTFGFLENVFIAPDFIKNQNISDGEDITCKAILSFNKRKNEWGWRGYEII
ncbi:DUF7017 domain-containing protein [Gaetbulibacter saemankumensis]|uniref:DUF7017 domain-containing protein n=1 Tax=Gaetbulibacter saemankumensis TaxID=311208 RepID=UPI000427713D|nr:hypothetical protein [Gaetbulibacter saemankumensis]